MVSYFLNKASSAISNCFNFIEAKEFVNNDNDFSPFEYEKNLCEKAGDVLLLPIGGSTDKIVRGMRRSPGVVIATVTALALVTFFFYTEATSEFLLGLVPWVSKITPKDLKFAGWAISQVTIFGFGLRTYGRFDNPYLKEAWENKEIRHLHTGAFRN